MQTQRTHALVALHSAVLLFALSGLFAKWLNMSATTIVFGRAFFCALTLAIVVRVFKRQSLKCSSTVLSAFVLTGGILAFHWVSFFQAIQVSSVAIGLITFASFPIFVSIFEPLFFNEKFYSRTLWQALFTFVGIYLIVPTNNPETSNIYAGVLWGVASALSFAILTLLNRKFVRGISVKQVAFYQNSFAALFVLPVMLMNPLTISMSQLSLIVLLGVVFTALAHSLFNYSLKTIKAQTAAVAVSLEPIYGILAAYWLLAESLSMTMVIGGVIVLATNVWAATNH
ncbi:EamA family transporter [Thalassotalea sp. G2M2-11]|uniref:DMT family transporter n=1 Tax=Thalassotalea sp. G2M2-11 TaxID=2787627 RepID=UPI0019D1B23F|nr:EamA family transporter [Thalassotalea sp. G2M2-11]